MSFKCRSPGAVEGFQMPRKRKAGRPRRSSRDEEATPDRILKAAKRVFAEKGYHSASLDEVAGEVDIRVPSLLYHFPTKQALYEGVVGELAEKSRNILDRVFTPEGDAAAKLQEVLKEFIALERDEPALLPVILADVFLKDSPGQDVILDVIAPMLDRSEVYFREHSSFPMGKKAPIREVMVMLLLAYSARSVMGSEGEKIWGPEDHTLDFVQILLSGLQRWKD